ncbi:hypothetical protein LSAT2_015168 [Lamellibrachia satsuma]|nr:hypothetical protein LSAT2_015168 [Lamellibrachia satsuma]
METSTATSTSSPSPVDAHININVNMITFACGCIHQHQRQHRHLHLRMGTSTATSTSTPSPVDGDINVNIINATPLLDNWIDQCDEGSFKALLVVMQREEHGFCISYLVTRLRLVVMQREEHGFCISYLVTRLRLVVMQREEHGFCISYLVTRLSLVGIFNRLVVTCLFVFDTRYPVSAAGAVGIKKAEVRMSKNPVWVGDPVLMTCVMTPRDATIRSMLWFLRDASENFINLYTYNTLFPRSSGPHERAKGRMEGRVSKMLGEHNLYINHTVVSDQCTYYCKVTDHKHIDEISIPIDLSVQVKLHDHKITVGTKAYSNCEDLDAELDDNVDGDNMEATCNVTSRPKSQLTWTLSHPDPSDDMPLLTEIGQSCSVATDQNKGFTCTSTVVVQMDRIDQARTKLTCLAEILNTQLSQTEDVCVTIFLPSFETDGGSTLTFSVALVAFAAVITSCSLRR